LWTFPLFIFIQIANLPLTQAWILIELFPLIEIPIGTTMAIIKTKSCDYSLTGKKDCQLSLEDLVEEFVCDTVMSHWLFNE
jgi:hypothetical protein